MTQGLQPASTGGETAEQVIWLEGPERGRRMPNIKVNFVYYQKYFDILDAKFPGGCLT